MKQSVRFFAVTVFLFFVFASLGATQARKDKIKDEQALDELDTTITEEKTSADIEAMIEDLSDAHDLTIKNFEDLRMQFDKTMQIADKDSLQAEMKKSRDMLTKLQKDLAIQQDMFNDILTSIETYGGIPELMNEPHVK